ncbi:MAG: HupE/UreJ family protein [Burkholderiaceae bacterium]
MLSRFVLFLAGLVASTAAAAHQSGNSYLMISDASGSARALSVQIDLSIKDLNGILQIPPGQATDFTPDKLAAIEAQLSQTIQQLLIVEAGGQALALSFVSQSVSLRNDGLYLRQAFAAPALPEPLRDLVVRYDFFNRGETVARAYAKLDIRGKQISSVFDARNSVQRFALAGDARLHTMTLFVKEGAMHIWSGADHLLFLLCVLLPGLSLVAPVAPSGSSRFRAAGWFALQVVTAFTVAHSITLAASATDWITLPDKWVEAAIALSIMASAALNLMFTGHAGRWQLAFAFGLIHGLGFASGLRELGLMQQRFLESLLAFNLGVELGQLVVLAAVATLLRPWLQRDWVRKRLPIWGSLLVLPLSGAWLTQRLLA